MEQEVPAAELALSDSRGFIEFISLVYSRLIRPFERQFREHFTNLQIITLCILRQNGATAVTELADRLCLSKQQMTKLAAKLCAEGCVRRITDRRDRRVVHLELTEKAEQMLTENRCRFARELTAALSADGDASRAEEFLRCTNRLAELMKELPVQHPGAHADTDAAPALPAD